MICNTGNLSQNSYVRTGSLPIDFNTGEDKKKAEQGTHHGGLYWDQGGPNGEFLRVDNRAKLNMGARIGDIG